MPSPKAVWTCQGEQQRPCRGSAASPTRESNPLGGKARESARQREESRAVLRWLLPDRARSIAQAFHSLRTFRLSTAHQRFGDANARSFREGLSGTWIAALNTSG
jgi:hypothetical protein